MSNTPNDDDLTACYREANGEMHGKAQPLTTQRIFRAMRAAIIKWGTPQPVVREPLTDEQIQDLLLCGNPTDEEMRLIRIGWDAAHDIKGGQYVGKVD